MPGKHKFRKSEHQEYIKNIAIPKEVYAKLVEEARKDFITPHEYIRRCMIHLYKSWKLQEDFDKKKGQFKQPPQAAEK